jgi:hypothetical protein
LSEAARYSHHVQRVVTVALWLLVAAGGAGIGRLALPVNGLRGHYFTNLTRSGQPVATAIDRSLSTDTLDNGIAGVYQSYSVEWSGFLVVDDDGDYTFATVSDDGSEIEVAGQVVVRNGGLHGAQEARGTVRLAAGLHPIAVRYEQAGGAFALSVMSGRTGEPLRTIPASVLLPDQLSYAEYRARRAAPVAGAAIAILIWIALTHALSKRPRSSDAPPAVVRALDRPAVAIAIIVVVGAVARIIVSLGSDAILWADSDVFLETFGAIRQGRYFEHEPHRTLFYPYLLWAILRTNTEPPMDQVVVAVQQLLGLASAVCLYLAARPVFGGRIALGGALLMSLHTTQLFYETSILSETLFTFVLMLCLIPLTRFVAQPSIKGAIVTGCCCAALTLTRPVAEWFFMLPLVCAMWTLRNWPARLKVAMALILTVGVFIVPWAALNQRQFGFFGVALGRGFGLFIRVFEIDRLDPPPDTAYPEVRDVLMRGRAAHESPATFVRDELGDRRTYSAPQKDALMYAAAMEAVRARPLTFAIRSLTQWHTQAGTAMRDEQICSAAQGPYLCSPRTRGYAREPFLNRPRYDREPVRPWVVAYFRHARIPIELVFALALFGILTHAAGRTRVVQGMFLALVIAYMTFLPAFAQSPQDRYRLPIDGLLFTFAAAGVAAAWSRSLRRRDRE